MTGFTAEGKEAYRLLDWANADQEVRLPVAAARVTALAAQVSAQSGALASRALAEVQDVGTVLSRLAGAHAVTLSAGQTISDQVLDLAIWSDITPFLARHRLKRDRMGRFAGSGKAIEAEVAAEIHKAAPKVPEPLSNRKLRTKLEQIEAEKAAEIKKLPAPAPPPEFSPPVKNFFDPNTSNDIPLPSISAQMGPQPLPKIGTPQIDQRVIAAHASNAVRQIQAARDSGTLASPEADKIESAVSSLAKTAQAAGRQLDQIRAENVVRDERLKRLEDALTQFQRRQDVSEKNISHQAQVNQLHDKYERALADERAKASRVRSLVVGIGSTMTNAAFTVGSFLALPDSAPASTHEWMLAAIPLFTAVAQGLWVPLYEAHKDKRLAKLNQQAEAKAAKAANLANDDVYEIAVTMLTQIFQSAGAPFIQAQQLARWLADEHEAGN